MEFFIRLSHRVAALLLQLVAYYINVQLEFPLGILCSDLAFHREWYINIFYANDDLAIPHIHKYIVAMQYK